MKVKISRLIFNSEFKLNKLLIFKVENKKYHNMVINAHVEQNIMQFIFKNVSLCTWCSHTVTIDTQEN